MQSATETRLISDYKSTGNVELVGKLYAPYMSLVYGLCLKYLSNSEMAKDAVMDIFEKLLIELKRHDVPTDFKVWLYVVSKNFCLMKLRRDGSENRAFKKLSSEFMENGIEMHPIDKVEEQDLDPLLKACIEKLKLEQRNAIELFYYKKHCYREIAEQLNVAEKSVKSDIQNGKRNLKICIEANS